MRDARLIETVELPVEAIEAGNRLRPVSEAALDALVASIEELGRMTDEIHVRRVKHRQGALVLIAGAHRLAAARRLGWEAIPAKVWDCTDDWAKLAEIDDNLAHGELAPLDLAVFLAERKRVYERLHPEAKHGIAGATARWNATDIVSAAKVLGETRGLSERHIRRLVTAGERLSQDEIIAFRTAERRPNLKDLRDFGAIEDADLRRSVLGTFAAGEVRSIAGAQKLYASPKPPRSASDQAANKLIDAWVRAPKTAKRRFIEERRRELFRMLEEMGELDQQ